MANRFEDRERDRWRDYDRESDWDDEEEGLTGRDFTRDYGRRPRGTYAGTRPGMGYRGEVGEPGWRGYGGRERYYGGEPEFRGYGGRETFYGERESWLTPGPFTGRGPRGWRRSDERIRDDVNDRLTQHGMIDASEIEVEVRDGEVMLRGTVDERRQKRMAEDVAESVLGVQDVNNQLRVKGMAGGRYAPTAGKMGMGTEEFRAGMDVFGTDGTYIGRVKDVRSNDFLVDRAMVRDVFVPFSARQSTSGGRITINVPADQVDNQGWETPEVMGETPGVPR